MGPAEWLRCPILLLCRPFFKLERMGLGVRYYQGNTKLRFTCVGPLFRSASEWNACGVGSANCVRLLGVPFSWSSAPHHGKGYSVSGKAVLCPRSRSRLPIGVRSSRPYQALSTLGLTGSSSCTAPGTEFLDFRLADPVLLRTERKTAAENQAAE